MIRQALLLAVALPSLLTACGSGPGTATAACTPLREASAIPDASGGQGTAYAATLYAGLGEISNSTNALFQRWPATEPANTPEFRDSFATYASRVICLATNMRDLPVPGAAFDDFHRPFAAAMDEQIAIATLGRDAVRQRNVTRYREWRTREESLAPQIRNAFAHLPR